MKKDAEALAMAPNNQRTIRCQRFYSSYFLLYCCCCCLWSQENLIPVQGKQQSVTDYVYGHCNYTGTSYDRNGIFARNLNTAMTILTINAGSGALYYLTLVKDDYTNYTSVDNTNSTSVYAMYQCRGDLSTQQCLTCLSSIMSSNICGAVLGLRIQFLGCYFRYDNSNFASFSDISLVHSNCSSLKNSTSSYQNNLSSALRITTSSAPTSGLFSTATVGSAHALSQCFGYLTESECRSCLSQSSSRSSFCHTSSSGSFYYASCFYLFSDTSFLFSNSSRISNSPAPAPAPASSPSPSRSPTSPSSILPSSPAALIGFIPPLSSGSPAGSASSRLSAAAIAGISVGSALGAVLAVFCVVCVVIRRQSVQSGDVKGGPMNPTTKNPSNFTVQELRAATEGFHSQNKLGQGSFGVVYKGTLEDGKEVAIKIISPDENRGKQTDFSDQLKLISTIQHRNLIQLLGYATSDDSRWYLVYEYLANKSLDLHLFDNTEEFEARALLLDWETRFSIIVGIARGLCYLHEEQEVMMVHQHIKASNILLGDKLEPKIADFGLARLFTDGDSHFSTTVAGGYVAPEYAMGGQLSDKVDVYSFGLVTLEIVSGRKVIQNNVEDAAGRRTHILQWAWDLYDRKLVAEMVDRRIIGSVNDWEVARAVHVALLCTQTRPYARPTMSQVYTMLCSTSTASQSAILDLPSRPDFIFLGVFSPSPNNVEQSESNSGVGVSVREYDENRHNWSISSTGTDMSANTASSGGSALEQLAEFDVGGQYGSLWSISSFRSVEKAKESRLDDTITELHAYAP